MIIITAIPLAFWRRCAALSANGRKTINIMDIERNWPGRRHPGYDAPPSRWMFLNIENWKSGTRARIGHKPPIHGTAPARCSFRRNRFVMCICMSPSCPIALGLGALSQAICSARLPSGDGLPWWHPICCFRASWCRDDGELTMWRPARGFTSANAAVGWILHPYPADDSSAISRSSRSYRGPSANCACKKRPAPHLGVGFIAVSLILLCAGFHFAGSGDFFPKHRWRGRSRFHGPGSRPGLRIEERTRPESDRWRKPSTKIIPPDQLDGDRRQNSGRPYRRHQHGPTNNRARSGTMGRRHALSRH